MASVNGLDLFQSPFWVLVVVAAVLTTLPLPRTARRRMLALVNSVALPVAAGWDSYTWGRIALGAIAAWVAALVLAAYLARCRTSLLHPWPALLLFLIIVAFAIHKRSDIAGPMLPDRLGSTSLRLLSAIGFSYVALRLIELVRGTVEERGPRPTATDVLNYVVPFHMLAAGPIESWQEYGRRDAQEGLTRTDALAAADRITQGMFKKYVLARLLNATCLTGFAGTTLLQQWLEMQFFTLWLYLDFSAYSDVALGVGQLIGVRTPRNFAGPLTSRNLVEFCERWHISLSQFVRRNIFIPVQLWATRRWPDRTLFVAAIGYGASFALCGLWHGLTLKYLLWGLLHASGLWTCTAYRTLLQRRLSRAGLERYRGSRLLRIGATVLTYQFVSVSLWIVAS